MSNDWIDISIPVRPGMAIWPGNPGVQLERSQCLHDGDVCNVSRLELGTHTGTHVDGINHFIKGGRGIDAAPLETFIGPARVVEVSSTKEIRLRDFDQSVIKSGQRILFKTANSRRELHRRPFQEDFVCLSKEVAAWLAEMKVPCVGVDYLSVGGFEGNVVEVHHILLGHGIFAVEGLVLTGIDPGWYDFICLPIRLVDGDAGLARAVIRKREAVS